MRGVSRVIISGTVEVGKRLGRRLGFPTANVRPDDPGIVLPPNGVYAAAFWVEDEPAAWMCMLNQGTHPTAPEGKPTIEANLLDFDGDLYGRHVKVEYFHFLRREHRFESLEALAAQLARDRDAVRAWIEASRSEPSDDPERRRAREIAWIS